MSRVLLRLLTLFGESHAIVEVSEVIGGASGVDGGGGCGYWC